MCRVAARNFPELCFVPVYFDFYCMLPTPPWDQNTGEGAVWSSPRWLLWILRWSTEECHCSSFGGDPQLNPSWMWGILPTGATGQFWWRGPALHPSTSLKLVLSLRSCSSLSIPALPHSLWAPAFSLCLKYPPGCGCFVSFVITDAKKITGR